MNIAEPPEKPKGRKKADKPRDALAELQAAMKARLAESEAQSVRPTLNPEPDHPKSENNPQAKPSISDPGLQWIDPSEWTSIMLRLADRGQKLIGDFLSRNQTFSTFIPSFDPAHLGEAFAELSGRLLNTPEKFIDAQLNLWQDYVRLWQTAFNRMAGQTSAPIITPAANDKRFQDAAWQDIWLFDYIKQSYLITSRWAQGLVQKVDGLDPRIARKIDFYTRQMVDAISPSNFWLTNPEVLRTTIETRGENLIKGLEHMLADLERGHGQLAINMSDNKAFRFGENIATTPGKVVYQNELMQLIQYTPMTETVHKTPLLIVPPWINKYYILDLREKNSLIRYLVEQGHTVFCISWVNPDARHAQINFDDYMTLGLLAAAREIANITQEKQLNVTGYCIGGTLLACTLAYLKALGKNAPTDLPEIASATYLVTLVDFVEPGDLGVFMDNDQITALEDRMAKQGYLDAPIMATTFSMLRANDLIWSFVVNNYLLGREPFPFDLLTWNSDSTNLPAAMQSFYMRKMYLENKLVQPQGVAMKDVPIDMRDIDTPSFLLSTRDDHIAPWRSTYAATQLYQGPVTFVLSGSGHIAGIINPPANNKYGYWTNDKCPPHPDDWLKDSEAHSGSWWPEWMKWLAPYAGPMVPARRPTNAIEDAPGSYVKVKAA